MSKIRIYLEDTYGTNFYKRLISRLKNHGLFPRNVGHSCKRLSVFCNKKINRDLNSVLIRTNTKGVILILDGDGDKDNKYPQAENHIPDEYPLPYEILLFEYEIEDLILYSEGTRINQKSSEYLKKTRNYKKSDLPSYADRLDLEVIKGHPVIQSLLEFVNSI